MFLKWLLQILLDEQGETDPAAGGDGQVVDSVDDGQGGDPGAGDSLGGDDGQGNNPPPATPAFGDFGDTPKTLEEATALLQKVYGEHSRLKPEFETLKGKTAATERNLALTRKALEGSGIKAVQGEDGSIRLEVVNQPKQERKTRFQDTHKALFDAPVLEALRYLIQDELDGGFDSRQKQSQETTRQRQVFNQMRNKSVDLMFSYFPQLDGQWDENGKPTNQAFNSAFHKRAEEIWKERYAQNPQGELLAALEAAKELNILATQTAQAKKEGFEAGKASKKILAPVNSGKSAAGAGSKLSREEYLKLSPADREVYDKRQIGL